jgi:hypothetical protein
MENCVYEGQAYDEHYDIDVFATTQFPERPRQKKDFSVSGHWHSLPESSHTLSRFSGISHVSGN